MSRKMGMLQELYIYIYKKLFINFIETPVHYVAITFREKAFSHLNKFI